MFGISGPEFIVLLAVAAVVLGPERLPQYAQGLARLIKELRRMAAGASQQVREELGPEIDEVDWRKLDPRQYDPRRIVREALSDSLDMEDPLGLRDKPVSSGGPTEQAPTALTGGPWVEGLQRSGEARAGSDSTRPPGLSGSTAAEKPAGRFDPDAT